MSSDIYVFHQVETQNVLRIFRRKCKAHIPRDGNARVPCVGAHLVA